MSIKANKLFEIHLSHISGPFPIKSCEQKNFKLLYKNYSHFSFDHKSFEQIISLYKYNKNNIYLNIFLLFNNIGIGNIYIASFFR